jgi:outer membrane protein TolC
MHRVLTQLAIGCLALLVGVCEGFAQVPAAAPPEGFPDPSLARMVEGFPRLEPAAENVLVPLPETDPAAASMGSQRDPLVHMQLESSGPVAEQPAAFLPAPRPAAGPAVPGVHDLNSLTTIVHRRHPALVRAHAEIAVAKGARVQAGLYPNPSFETNNPEYWAGRVGQVNFGFQQDVITKGKMRLEKAAADQSVRKAEGEYIRERFVVLSDLRANYFVVLAARQRVQAMEQYVALAEQSLNAAQKLVDAGQGSTTDVLLIRTELQRARMNRENAHLRLRGDMRRLVAATGDPDLEITDLTGSVFDSLPEFNEAEIRNFLVSRSVFMEIGYAEILRNRMKLRRQEVQPYPDLRFGPSYAMTTNDSRGQFWLSVIFEIPVWNMNQGNIRAAQAQLRRSLADLDARRLELLREFAEVAAEHAAAANSVKNIRETILPNAIQAQQQVGEGFEKGVFDVTRVLQARRALLDVNNDLIDASEQAWTTGAVLAGLLQRERFP